MSLSARLTGLAFRVRLWCLLALGLRSAAAGCATRRLQQAPHDTHALATLAHLLAVRGHMADAQALLERLVALRPDDASAWFNLGYVLDQQQNAAAAEAAFRQATARAPRLDQAWYGLALCLIAQRRLDEAVAALRRATDLQPMSPFAWYQLARVHAERGEPGPALGIIEHLRGFEPHVAAQLVRETGLGTPGASA